MSQVYKPLSNTISIASNGGNTVYGAKFAMIYNRGNQYELIILRHANNVLIGNLPIEHGTYLVLRKNPDDKLSGNNLIATSIAMPNG